VKTGSREISGPIAASYCNAITAMVDEKVKGDV